MHLNGYVAHYSLCRILPRIPVGRSGVSVVLCCVLASLLLLSIVFGTVRFIAPKEGGANAALHNPNSSTTSPESPAANGLTMLSDRSSAKREADVGAQLDFWLELSHQITRPRATNNSPPSAQLNTHLRCSSCSSSLAAAGAAERQPGEKNSPPCTRSDPNARSSPFFLPSSCPVFAGTATDTELSARSTGISAAGKVARRPCVGSVVVSVNGVRTQGLSFANVVQLLNTRERPMVLEFVDSWDTIFHQHHMETQVCIYVSHHNEARTSIDLFMISFVYVGE